ncbi:MAG: HemK2/MTQ2 family protein methyltransferase [Candidatus Anstonellaceae archaeon]
MIEKIYFEDQIILIKPNKEVYYPMEDTFLLLKNLKNIKGKILEIGTGSGAISIYLAKKFPKLKLIFATDKNKIALKNCSHNARLNNVENQIKFFYSDLFERVPKQKFDFIIFNPPYLPTKKEEKIKNSLNLAFDGGEDGLRTIERFLKDAKKFLKKNGFIYLVVSDLADLLKLKRLIKKFGYCAKVIGEERFFFERILLYKIKKNNS